MILRKFTSRQTGLDRLDNTSRDLKGIQLVGENQASLLNEKANNSMYLQFLTHTERDAVIMFSVLGASLFFESSQEIPQCLPSSPSKLHT